MKAFEEGKKRRSFFNLWEELYLAKLKRVEMLGRRVHGGLKAAVLLQKEGVSPETIQALLGSSSSGFQGKAFTYSPGRKLNFLQNFLLERSFYRNLLGCKVEDSEDFLLCFFLI